MAPPCRFCGGHGAYGWHNYDSPQRTCATPYCVSGKLPPGILARLDHEKVYDPFRQCGWLGDRVADLFRQREALADVLEVVLDAEPFVGALDALDRSIGCPTQQGQFLLRARAALRAAGRLP